MARQGSEQLADDFYTVLEEARSSRRPILRSLRQAGFEIDNDTLQVLLGGVVPRQRAAGQSNSAALSPVVSAPSEIDATISELPVPRSDDSAIEDSSWFDDGACQDVPYEYMNPPHGRMTPQARRACLSCAVFSECLEWITKNPDELGNWALTSEADRAVPGWPAGQSETTS